MSRRVPELYAFEEMDTALEVLKTNAYVDTFTNEMKKMALSSDLDKVAPSKRQQVAWDRLKTSDDPVEIAVLAMMIWHNSVEGE